MKGRAAVSIDSIRLGGGGRGEERCTEVETVKVALAYVGSQFQEEFDGMSLSPSRRRVQGSIHLEEGGREVVTVDSGVKLCTNDHLLVFGIHVCSATNESTDQIAMT